MVLTESNINALISVGGTLLGAATGGFITYKIITRQIKSNNQQFIIKNLHEKKINSLIELYDIVVDTVDSINFHANIGIDSYDEFKEEIQNKIDSYKMLKQKAEIWFDSEVNEFLSQILGIFRKLAHKLFLQTGKKDEKQLKKELEATFKTEDWTDLLSLKDRIKSIIFSSKEFVLYQIFIEKNTK